VTAWKKAHDCANTETGVGLQESGDPEDIKTFKEAVLKKYKHYFDLLDVMVDRASTTPKTMSYESTTDEDESVGLLDGGNDDNDSEIDLFPNDNDDSVFTGEVENNSKRPASIVTTRPSKPKTKKCRGSITGTSMIGDEIVAVLEKANFLRNRKFRDEMTERKRHNQVMEEVAQNELERASKMTDVEIERHEKQMEKRQIEMRNAQLENERMQFDLRE
jgi:hypothetical protein